MTKEEFKTKYAKEIADGSIHNMSLPYNARHARKYLLGDRFAFNDEYYTRKPDFLQETSLVSF